MEPVKPAERTVLTPEEIKPHILSTNTLEEINSILENAFPSTPTPPEPSAAESQPDSPTVSAKTLAKDVRVAKSNLMKQMIKDKDIIKVDSSILTSSEKKYIFKEIKKEILAIEKASNNESEDK